MRDHEVFLPTVRLVRFTLLLYKFTCHRWQFLIAATKHVRFHNLRLFLFLVVLLVFMSIFIDHVHVHLFEVGSLGHLPRRPRIEHLLLLWL